MQDAILCHTQAREVINEQCDNTTLEYNQFRDAMITYT